MTFGKTRRPGGEMWRTRKERKISRKDAKAQREDKIAAKDTKSKLKGIIDGRRVFQICVLRPSAVVFLCLLRLFAAFLIVWFLFASLREIFVF